jgi:hypothetical protein
MLDPSLLLSLAECALIADDFETAALDTAMRPKPQRSVSAEMSAAVTSANNMPNAYAEIVTDGKERRTEKLTLQSPFHFGEFDKCSRGILEYVSDAAPEN